MHATAVLAVSGAPPRAVRTIGAASPLAGRAPVAARSVTARAPARSLGALRNVTDSAHGSKVVGRAAAALADELLAESTKAVDLPFSDITLCAELDGATVRAHRGVLSMHSKVFADAFSAPAASDMKECVLLNKRGSDLRLLLSWVYRQERVSKVRRGQTKQCVTLRRTCHAHCCHRRTTSKPCARSQLTWRCHSCWIPRTCGW